MSGRYDWQTANFCEVPGSGVSTAVGFPDRHFGRCSGPLVFGTRISLTSGSAKMRQHQYSCRFQVLALAQEWGNTSTHNKTRGGEVE
jgi:hypothetical protein